MLWVLKMAVNELKIKFEVQDEAGEGRNAALEIWR